MWDRLTPSQLGELLDTSHDALLVLDSDGQPRAANAALLRLLDTGLDGLGPDHPLLAANADSLSYTGPRGERLELQVRYLPLTDGSRALWFRDHSEQQRLERELAEQSLTDPVTGLLNHRGLGVALEPQVSRCRRYDSPLSLVLLELHGEVDNQARIRVSRILKDQLRWADMIGCSEDQRFILALPETRQADAEQLIAKLHERLAAEFADAGVDAAFGLAEWRKADNTQTLINRAAQTLDPAAGTRTAAG
ncbi:GGDEF domain-containing protein [Thiohalobacter thiocyanaticus]|uniref:diguanylate cyclase n=1 Tax=Thiohalobacter thiocyanaticus TaxID=585455 RepID=A0A426QJF0_9GAMM|nr:diguanylate cyclase [Thiohalobacter thiocyanaticus]RRQ21875.1 diguanylate cyclase [Thiohalobacter thiocyanaticus]